MTNLESLRSLQKRIREATKPDRELDAAIAKAFGMPHGYHEWIEDRTYYDTFEQAARFTTDPDGLGPCVALQRAVLPEWKWDVFQRHISEKDKRFSVGLSAPNGDHAHAYHRFEPLARLLVIVGALIAQEEAKEKADV